MNPAVVAARLEQTVDRALARLLWRRGWRVRLLAFPTYGGPGWVRVLGRALLSSAPGAELELGRGWRRFLTVPLPGVAVEVTVDESGPVVLRTGPGGYLDSVVAADLAPGWHDVTLTGHHGPAARGQVRVVGADERVGIVSDIDDTVIVTALPRPLRAFWNTFVRLESSRRPVPGMAALFARLRADDPEPFTAYVSTGAWNVAPSVGRFLAHHDFPAGPMLMTDWGPGDGRWFRSGRAHKHDTLRRLLSDLPGLTWTLVGDDGQHDPALYEDLAAEAPDRVGLILIRELTQAEQVRTHGSPTARPGEGAHDTPRRSDVPVLRGPDGHALAAALDGLRVKTASGPPGEGDRAAGRG